MKERVFSAPGRIEIGGNHTDHQHGRVLAAAVDLRVRCKAAANGTGIINIESDGYPAFSIDLTSLEARDDEKGTAASLVRGVAAWFRQHGYKTGGFDAQVSSDIPAGSGLSSSAAFEVLIGNVFKHLFGAEVSPLEIALAGKYAENIYYGKPCGLMDQAASSCGGLSMIDFSDPENAVVTPVDAKLDGYEICIVDTGGSHDNLTDRYAAIPQEMSTAASFFGKEYLNDVEPERFFEKIGEMRRNGISDRAVLRAMHFFGDNERVLKQAQALQDGKIDEFFDLVTGSGHSSAVYLQNVFMADGDGGQSQGLTLALALSERVLSGRGAIRRGRGAWRVHGGGFAGTILAFVPLDLKEEYESVIGSVFGGKACRYMTISPDGGREDI